jgi:hypothetical protein
MTSTDRARNAPGREGAAARMAKTEWIVSAALLGSLVLNGVLLVDRTKLLEISTASGKPANASRPTTKPPARKVQAPPPRLVSPPGPASPAESLLGPLGPGRECATALAQVDDKRGRWESLLNQNIPVWKTFSESEPAPALTRKLRDRLAPLGFASDTLDIECRGDVCRIFARDPEDPSYRAGVDTLLKAPEFLNTARKMEVEPRLAAMLFQVNEPLP